MEIELKPCPFCGGKAVMTDGTYTEDRIGQKPASIECSKCGARIAIMLDNEYWYDNWDEGKRRAREKLAARWNNRY